MGFNRKLIYAIRKSKLGVGSALIGIALFSGMVDVQATEGESLIETVSEHEVSIVNGENARVLENAEVQPEVDALNDEDFKPVDNHVVDIPNIPSRSEAFPEEGNDIPMDRVFRAAGDVINKSDFSIGLRRNDTDKNANDYSDLNGKSMNLNLDVSVMGVDNKVNGAKIEVYIPQDVAHSNGAIISSRVSGMNSNQTVDEEVIDVNGVSTKKYTVNVGNVVSGVDISLPVLVNSKSGFNDTRTDTIKYKLVDLNNAVIVEGTQDLSFTRLPLPVTKIKLAPKEIERAKKFGVQDAETNPAIVRDWNVDRNTPNASDTSQFDYIKYDIFRNLYTTLEERNDLGSWDNYKLRITSSEGTVISESKAQLNVLEMPLSKGFNGYSIEYAENEVSRGSEDLEIKFTRDLKRINSIDFKIEVIDGFSNTVLDDFTTHYSHRVIWHEVRDESVINVNKDKYVSEYVLVNNLLINRKEPDYTIGDGSGIMLERAGEPEFGVTYGPSWGTADRTAIHLNDKLSINEQNEGFASIELNKNISNIELDKFDLIGITHFGVNKHDNRITERRTISKSNTKTAKSFRINPLTIASVDSGSVNLGDYTWTISKIWTPEDHVAKSEVPVTDKQTGAVTQWNITDVEHRYENVKVYKENINSGTRELIGRLGDLLTSSAPIKKYSSEDDRVYANVKYAESIATLTQDERLIFDLDNERIDFINVQATYSLSADQYKNVISENTLSEALGRSQANDNSERLDSSIPYLYYTSSADIVDGSPSVDVRSNGAQLVALKQQVDFSLKQYPDEAEHLYSDEDFDGEIDIVSTYINDTIETKYYWALSVISDISGDKVAEEIKYIIEIPEGLTISELYKDNQGSREALDYKLLKSNGSTRIYEVMMDNPLSPNNREVEINAVYKYNDAIIPLDNTGEPIDWSTRNGVIYKPLSGVTYEPTQLDDMYDANNDGFIEKPSSSEEITPNKTHVDMLMSRGYRLLTPSALFIYNKNSTDGGLNYEFDNRSLRAGSDNHVKTYVLNNSDIEYSDMFVVTTIPRVGDDKLDGSEDRGSTINPTLKSAVSAPDGWTVEYTLNEHVDGTNVSELDGWVSADQITDFTKVKAIRYRSNPGVKLQKGQSVEFPFILSVPADAEPASRIVSTSAIKTNRGGQYLEGYRTVSEIFKPTGAVVVRYEDVDGKKIKDDVRLMPSTTYVDTPYDAAALKLDAISRDEINYNFDRLKETSEPEKGVVTEGGKEVVSTTPTNATYTVDEQNGQLAEIVKDNIRYTFAEVKDAAPLTGTLPVGDKVITLIYDKTPITTRQETGKVVVRYVTENGQSIKDNFVGEDQLVETVEEQPMADGSKTVVNCTNHHATYDVMNEKFNEIEFDGKVYRYVRHEGKAPTGELEVGLNEITFVYDVVKGDVEVRYVDMNGTEIKDKVATYDNQPIKSDYDVNAQKMDEIEFDGKVYRYVRTDGESMGKVKEEITVVTYVYDVIKGDVEVQYVDVNGTEIKDKVVTHDDQPIKSDYDVNAQKENEIEFDGMVYRYVRTDGDVTGKVKEGTIIVTYVYDVVKGDVEVRYVDMNGTEIKNKVVTYDDQPIKSDYDVNAQKMDEIEFNGKVYRYVRTDGEPTGEIKEETTVVTYVYNVVPATGDVEVRYVGPNGEPLKGTILAIDNDVINSGYDVSEFKLPEIEVDGKVYRIRKVEGNESGIVTSDKTVVTYIYDIVAGSVDVAFKTVDGKELKSTVNAYVNTPVKSQYDVESHGLPELKIFGKTYRLVRTDGNVKGIIVEKPTVITYIYEEVKDDEPIVFDSVDVLETIEKVPNDYPTVDEVDSDILENMVDVLETVEKVPNNYPTVEKTTATIEDDEVVEIPELVDTTPTGEVNESVQQSLPNTGEGDQLFTAAAMLTASALGGLIVGRRRRLNK